MQTITKQINKLKRFKRDKRGISTVITVMLSLVLVVIIVGNVFIASYQMNQVDMDRNQENLALTNVASVPNSPWFNAQTEYSNSSGTRTGGTFIDTQAEDSSFETFTEGATQTAQSLIAHSESTSLGGTSYYTLLSNSADASGLTLTKSMGSLGRVPFGSFVYSLQGISFLPASTWTIYYRTWQDAPSTLTVTNSPSANSGVWTNPTNAYASGGGYAYSPSNNQQNVYSGYAFSIPSGATISRVRVRLDAYCVNNDGIRLEVSANGGSSWLTTTQTQSLTTSQTTYWIDVTTWTSWTPAQINGNQIYSRVTHLRSGTVDQVRLDWIPIEVTYNTGAAGHADADILIRKSDGSVRTTIATNVAASGNLPNLPATLFGTYSFSGYTVASQTDYLEVDYFLDVSVASSANAYLRIDDNALSAGDQTRITGLTSSSSYRLNITNSYNLDLQSYPKNDINDVEILLRYNVSDAGETWFIEAYDWNTLTFSNAGFNDTGGIQPVAGQWNEYAVNVTSNLANYIAANGTILLQFSDGGASAIQTTIGIDFLGVRVVIHGVSMEIENSSPLTVHVVALWITNSASHKRFDVDLFLNAGESNTVTRGDVTLPGGSFVAKVVTERGNIAVFSSG